MAFVITKDHISEGNDRPNVGVFGPTGYNGNQADIRDKGEHFRMYDDDGELYYEGYFYPHNEDSDEFEPLSFFGTPSAGCTEIRYRNKKTNKYETL